jgi:hypothetical protein
MGNLKVAVTHWLSGTPFDSAMPHGVNMKKRELKLKQRKEAP